MLCIISEETSATFNLAAEEYLFRNFEEDIFFLYRNEPAVVLGKHQNAMAEVNPMYVNKNNVHVVRRLSGGGAVYHDLGNLNFSFHQTVPDTSKVSFRKFNEPIVELLRSIGVDAQISKRNDIFIHEFKVSGHAQHVFRNRILSHGTLLFSADKNNLSLALKNNSGTFTGKAIQSVRSKVANIADFLPKPMAIGEFENILLQYILQLNSGNNLYVFSVNDLKHIQQLKQEKYDTWEWNYGYSPNYCFEKQTREHSISVEVEKGIIKDIEIISEALSVKLISQLKALLTGTCHSIEQLEGKINSLTIEQSKTRELVELFF